VTPFEKSIERLNAARAEARKIIRDCEALARAAAADDTPSRKVQELQNAIVEAKKHRATAVADMLRLDRHAHADYPGESPLVDEQQRLQRPFVEEVTTAVARLETLCDELRWNEIHARAGGALAQAHAALAEARAAVARAEALPIDTLARDLDKVITDLNRALTAAKNAVAATIADRNRFAKTQAEMQNLARPNWDRPPPHPADPAVMVRTLAAQQAAVDDLKQELFEVNDSIENVKRAGRIEIARQRLGSG